MNPPDRSNHSSQARPQIVPPIMVDNVSALSRLQDDLADIKRLAVDTESNSLFAYQERVCLIQLSTDRRDYLVDPLRLGKRVDLSFLGSICADPSIEKVLHAAEYDVMTLRRDYGFDFANLFDTMIAARILGMERVGLGALMEERFGVKADKRHQRANWGKRPLTPDMIRYAQMDTHYLLPLRDELHEQIGQRGGIEEASELFHEVAQARWSGPPYDPEGFWRINGNNHLSLREMAILEALYHFREQQAQQRDLPVFKIISDEALLALASAKPATLRDLANINGIGHGLLDRYGLDLLKVVAQGYKAPLPKRPPPREQTDDVVQKRFDMLHTWRKERAVKRGVSSEVILSRDALWHLAQNPPRTRDELEAIQSIGPWRARTYGEELLTVLASMEQHNK
jgi:ribonuclease D